MCDLALNDDGNMVRRQEKKTGGENHIAAITLFFYVLWSIFPAFLLYIGLCNFEYVYNCVFPFFFSPCGFLLDEF